MGTELITTALVPMTYFSWWWLLAPVVLSVLMVAVGAALREDGLWGTGLIVGVGGTVFMLMINISAPSYDEDLLRSDVSDQLQIEETVKDGDWYLGKGPDGEYVRFALVEKDGAEDTYAVLVEK